MIGVHRDSVDLHPHEDRQQRQLDPLQDFGAALVRELLGERVAELVRNVRDLGLVIRRGRYWYLGHADPFLAGPGEVGDRRQLDP